jgi:hypothetical protein
LPCAVNARSRLTLSRFFRNPVLLLQRCSQIVYSAVRSAVCSCLRKYSAQRLVILLLRISPLLETTEHLKRGVSTKPHSIEMPLDRVATRSISDQGPLPSKRI